MSSLDREVRSGNGVVGADWMVVWVKRGRKDTATEKLGIDGNENEQGSKGEGA